jgi:hypothetical protein
MEGLCILEPVTRWWAGRRVPESDWGAVLLLSYGVSVAVSERQLWFCVVLSEFRAGGKRLEAKSGEWQASSRHGLGNECEVFEVRASRRLGDQRIMRTA